MDSAHHWHAGQGGSRNGKNATADIYLGGRERHGSCDSVDDDLAAGFPVAIPRDQIADRTNLPAQDGLSFVEFGSLTYVVLAPIRADLVAASPARGEVAVKALEEIERLYWIEGQDLAWRAAHMKGVARNALNALTASAEPAPATDGAGK